MIHDSVLNGSLVWGTIEVDGVTRPKTYEELSKKEKFQADCDLKATNIVLQGDDLITCLNKVISFMSIVMAFCFPSTNNQLRTSSNLRNQATIQDGRFTVQQVQGRQSQSFVGMGTKGNAASQGGNNVASQARIVKCYNFQGEGYMARQCTQPKRPRNSAWFKEKMLLVQARESSQVLDEEQLASLADPGIAEGQQKRFLWKVSPVMIQTSSSRSSCYNLLQPEPFPHTSLSCEDLGKLKPKADIGIFIGYAPEVNRHEVLGYIDTIMTDFEDSTVMYTTVSSPCEGRSGDISPGVDGPPVMPEDPYAYVVAAFQALPPPDYVPGLEEPEQAPSSPVYIPYVPESVYPEYIPPEDDVFLAEEQPLPAAASPTADSPGYIPESDLDEDPEDDDEDLEEDPADYLADHDDDEEEEEPSGVTPLKMRVAAKYCTGALLRNITATDT
nr:hypothetical protein [Tanacetum cinerariifolium]